MGRRWGKTTGATEIFLRKGIESQIAVGWFAHVWKSVKIAWSEFNLRIPPSAIRKKSESDMMLELNTGSRYHFFSLDNPESALGHGFDWAILDEGARISKYARDEVVYPMTIDRGGRILTITTPKGKKGRGAWVWRDWKKAQGGVPGYAWLQGSTLENPLPSIREWCEFYKANVPEEVYRQEILGEFLENVQSVIDLTPIAVNGGSEDKPVGLPFFEDWNSDGADVEPWPSIWGGLDLAQKHNWTVLTLFTEDGRLKAMDRFRWLGWEAQVARVVETLKRYCRTKAEAQESGLPQRDLILYVDSTGIGGPVLEDLYSAIVELPIQLVAVPFSNERKQTMIQGLQLAVEKREISAPWIIEMISEGETMEADTLASGRVRYQAAGGFDDDIIWSMALGIYGLNRRIRGVVL